MYYIFKRFLNVFYFIEELEGNLSEILKELVYWLYNLVYFWIMDFLFFLSYFIVR